MRNCCARLSSIPRSRCPKKVQRGAFFKPFQHLFTTCISGSYNWCLPEASGRTAICTAAAPRTDHAARTGPTASIWIPRPAAGGRTGAAVMKDPARPSRKKTLPLPNARPCGSASPPPGRRPKRNRPRAGPRPPSWPGPFGMRRPVHRIHTPTCNGKVSLLLVASGSGNVRAL